MSVALNKLSRSSLSLFYLTRPPFRTISILRVAARRKKIGIGGIEVIANGKVDALHTPLRPKRLVELDCGTSKAISVRDEMSSRIDSKQTSTDRHSAITFVRPG